MKERRKRGEIERERERESEQEREGRQNMLEGGKEGMRREKRTEDKKCFSGYCF